MVRRLRVREKELKFNRYSSFRLVIYFRLLGFFRLPCKKEEALNRSKRWGLAVTLRFLYVLSNFLFLMGRWLR